MTDLAITCAGCATTRPAKPRAEGGVKLPPRWKAFGDQTLCGACAKDRYALRAITIPVVGPIDTTWAEVRPRLRAAFADVTACANWMVTTLYCRDVRRTAETPKLPPLPPIYLYPEARRQWPALASQTVAQLEQSVKRTYAATRYDLLWTGRRTLATLRYPQPIPLPAQMWTLERHAEGYAVSLRLQDTRVTFRLRGGAQFRRQRRQLDQIAGGIAFRAGAVLRETAVQPAAHRSAGSQPFTRLLVTLVAYLPREAATDREDDGCVLRTTATALAVLDDTWRYHGRDLLRVSATAARQQDELRRDRSVRQRAGEDTTGIVARMGDVAHKTQARMTSGLHMAAAAVIAEARRRGAMLEYAAIDPGFAEGFPWFRWRQLLAEKAHAAGLRYVDLTSDAPDVPLADGVSA